MAKGKAETLFRSKAPDIMALLMQDFPIGLTDAAAILGNAGHESAGFSILQEIKPVVAGSRGGWGWFQWTGPRRRDFEAYCKRNGLDPTSDKANYGWLFVELKGPERRAIPAVTAAVGIEAKVKAFELAFERAGAKHYASRNQWARIALDAWHEVQLQKPPQKPVDAQDPAPTTSDTGKTDKTPPAPLPESRRGFWAVLLSAFGIGVGSSALTRAQADQLAAWLIFGGLGAVVIVVAMIWYRGRK